MHIRFEMGPGELAKLRTPSRPRCKSLNSPALHNILAVGILLIVLSITFKVVLSWNTPYGWKYPAFQLQKQIFHNHESLSALRNGLFIYIFIYALPECTFS